MQERNTMKRCFLVNTVGLRRILLVVGMLLLSFSIEAANKVILKNGQTIVAKVTTYNEQ